VRAVAGLGRTSRGSPDTGYYDAAFVKGMRWTGVSLLVAVLAACSNPVSGHSVSASQGTVEFREVVGSPDAGTPTGAPPPSAPPSRFGGPRVLQPPPSGTSDNDRQNVDLSDDAAVRAALRALDCSVPVRGRIDAARPLVACDRQSVKYALKPAFLTGAEVAQAHAEFDAQNGTGWLVQLSFTSNGSKLWADFTAASVGKQVAVVLDGKVVSAPTIQEAITGGATQISGNFTQADATDLAARLTSR
jgi:hypothetical protein